MRQHSTSEAVAPARHRSPAGPRVAPSPSESGLLFTVGRALGVVVVTLHGTLDRPGCERLEHVLGDLIDNQGNLKVVVDLLDLSQVEEGGSAVFERAAASAAKRGGELTLADPCDALHRALDASGLGSAVSVTGRFSSSRWRRVSSAGGPATRDRRPPAARRGEKGAYRSGQPRDTA